MIAVIYCVACYIAGFGMLLDCFHNDEYFTGVFNFLLAPVVIPAHVGIVLNSYRRTYFK